MINNKFDSIFFGGTGWNLLWSFGASYKLHELNFRQNFNIRRVGSLSAGCMSALAFLDAASYDIGIVQCTQLKKCPSMFSLDFRTTYKYFFENFANQNVLEDIKKSGCEFYASYVNVGIFSELKLINSFIDRDDLLETCLAGCYIPGLFGIENKKYFLPKLRNGDYAIDGGFSGSSYCRWDERTLVISPNEISKEDTIGGGLDFLSTAGYQKIKDKELFLKGYDDASNWYERFIHKKYEFAWNNFADWDNKNIKLKVI